MYEYYDAVLHAVREGLVLLDTDSRVELVNDRRRELLGARRRRGRTAPSPSSGCPAR